MNIVTSYRTTDGGFGVKVESGSYRAKREWDDCDGGAIASQRLYRFCERARNEARHNASTFRELVEAYL